MAGKRKTRRVGAVDEDRIKDEPEAEISAPRVEESKLSALEELLVAYENGEMPSPEKLVNLLAGTYHALTDEYRPLVQAALPSFAELIGCDLGIVLAAFVKLQAEVVGSNEFYEALSELTRARAENRRMMWKGYQTAGFSPEQAFELVKLDIAQGNPLSVLSALASKVEMKKS